MKKRIGFVSNSSSSSFIVAAKPGQSLIASIKYDIDLTRYVRDKIVTVKDLEDYMLEKHGFEGYGLDKILQREYAKEEYNMIYDHIQKGLIVYRGSASNEEGGEEQMLCDIGINTLEFKDDVIVIEGEGGY